MATQTQLDLKKVVEASSGGAQTVLFTKSGQPTFVNVIKKFNVEGANPALVTAGITGVHPAFKVGAKVLDQIYVGTYPTALVNGELVSQPWQTAIGVGNFYASQLVPLFTATGLNAHGCTTAEASLLRSLCLQANYNPLGNDALGASSVNNTQFGIRIDGKSVGSADTTSTNALYGMNKGTALLTGSSPASFRFGNSPTGISDIGSGYIGLTYGVRIIKGEVQVHKDALLKNNADSSYDLYTTIRMGNSNHADFLTDWRAIDATTGALITPTYTGTLTIGETSGVDSGNYVVTTPNSVKITEGATNLATGFHNRNNLATEGNLPAKVIAILRYLGVIAENAPTINGQPVKNGYMQLAIRDLNVPCYSTGNLLESTIYSFNLLNNPRMFYYD